MCCGFWRQTSEQSSVSVWISALLLIPLKTFPLYERGSAIKMAAVVDAGISNAGKCVGLLPPAPTKTFWVLWCWQREAHRRRKDRTVGRWGKGWRFVGQCVRIKVLMDWVTWVPGAAWRSNGLGATPSGQVRGSGMACSGTKRWMTLTVCLARPTMQRQQDNGPLRPSKELYIHNNFDLNYEKWRQNMTICEYCLSGFLLYTCT